MLSIEIVQQILEEHDVFQVDPSAANQMADIVIYHTALKRAEVYGREPRIEDAVFAFWSWCWPGWPQAKRYTAFMRTVHHYLFEAVDEQTVIERATTFFTPEFLQLRLDLCASIVNTIDVLEEQGPGEKLRMFEAAMLPPAVVPALEGDIFVPAALEVTARSVWIETARSTGPRLLE